MEILLAMNSFTLCADFYFLFFRNLLFLKNYSGNVEDLSLNFTVVNNELGESQVNETRHAYFHTGNYDFVMAGVPGIFTVA